MVSHFVLDQNFPWHVVRFDWPPALRLTPLRQLDSRLIAGYEDWQVLLALHQRGDVQGFITNDAGILELPREMVVLSKTRLVLVLTDGVGHDPLRATGLVMLYLQQLAAQSDGSPMIHVLRLHSHRTLRPGTQINTLANRLGVQPNELISSELRDVGDLSAPVL